MLIKSICQHILSFYIRQAIIHIDHVKHVMANPATHIDASIPILVAKLVRPGQLQSWNYLPSKILITYSLTSFSYVECISIFIVKHPVSVIRKSSEPPYKELSYIFTRI